MGTETARVFGPRQHLVGTPAASVAGVNEEYRTRRGESSARPQASWSPSAARRLTGVCVRDESAQGAQAIQRGRSVSMKRLAMVIIPGLRREELGVRRAISRPRREP